MIVDAALSLQTSPRFQGISVEFPDITNGLLRYLTMLSCYMCCHIALFAMHVVT